MRFSASTTTERGIRVEYQSRIHQLHQLLSPDLTRGQSSRIHIFNCQCAMINPKGLTRLRKVGDA